MSQKNNTVKVPAFSSPHAIWNDSIQGNSQESNAGNALNDTATTTAIFYERTWGVLAEKNRASKSELFLIGLPGVK